MEDMTFICVFTTGRSGTAFLAQVFGMSAWSKNRIYNINQDFITHENWTGFPIYRLKKLVLDSTESIEIQREFLEMNLYNFECSNDSKYFITDHKIGRFFGHSLPYLKCNYKIIYLERNKADVIASFLGRWKNHRKCRNNYEEFYNKLWAIVFYTPLDAFAINRVKNWNNYTDKQKLEWYWDETKLQWENLKKKLDNNAYIEVKFEDLKSGGLDKISDFIQLPYSKKLIDVYVNLQKKE